MESKEFKILGSVSSITLEKGRKSITIRQASDDDILFSTSENNIELALSLHSLNNIPEQRTYLAFESLMKSIIGRYMLSGDYRNEYCTLPKDFIDLENKVITWHSDGTVDSALYLTYQNGTIVVSLSKSATEKDSTSNVVRVRTDGSDYGGYYKEFLNFFEELNALEKSLNTPIECAPPQLRESNKKVLSLLKRLGKKEK